MENEQLLQYIEKIERLNTEIDGLRSDIREICNECRQNGFSIKALKEVIKLRKMNKIDRDEFEFERQKYLEILENN